MFYDKKYYLQKRNPSYYNYARLQQASGHNLQKTYNVHIGRNSSNSRLFHHHFSHRTVRHLSKKMAIRQGVGKTPALLQELLTRLVGKVVYGACLGRETDAYIVYLATVGGVWLGVALFFYLF